MYVCMYSHYFYTCMFVCLVVTLPKIATNSLPMCVGIRFADRANPLADLPLRYNCRLWFSFDVNSHFHGKFAVPRAQGLGDYLAFLLIFHATHLFLYFVSAMSTILSSSPIVSCKIFHHFCVGSERARTF